MYRNVSVLIVSALLLVSSFAVLITNQSSNPAADATANTDNASTIAYLESPLPDTGAAPLYPKYPEENPTYHG
jgi:hypothetical protein